jgi:hypothetical protein
MAPIAQTSIKGMKVCGLRSGNSFKDAVRNIDLEVGGRCPPDYQSCGEETPSPENTWCIPASSDKETECPITKFKFIR